MHVSAKSASTACAEALDSELVHVCELEDCSVRFISRLNYKIQAWRNVYDSLCIRQVFPRARRSCPQERSLRVGNTTVVRSCCTPRNFRRHRPDCIRHLKSGGEKWAYVVPSCLRATMIVLSPLCGSRAMRSALLAPASE
jgi:hypothetical protein